jgi:hypothetical protein
MARLAVFKRLAPLLVEAIPPAVATRKPPRPLCRLRVYYYDTHAPCTYLLLQPATARWRDKLLAQHGQRGPEFFWLSTEDGGDLPGIDFEGRGEITELFGQVYDLLCDNEDRYMVPFREMVQRVCRTLNGTDWPSVCAVTDDFFVVPADGSMHFGDDYPDIVRSVPASRLKLLRSRGLGPPEDWAS